MRHEFVDFIPEQLENDVLYIACSLGTVVHLCFCGCGNQVVTPLTPTDWRITYDGETVSLAPSVGNWNLPCRSHYWIENGRVEWAAGWSDDAVRAARQTEQNRKDHHYERRSLEDAPAKPDSVQSSPRRTRLRQFARWMIQTIVGRT